MYINRADATSRRPLDGTILRTQSLSKFNVDMHIAQSSNLGKVPSPHIVQV